MKSVEPGEWSSVDVKFTGGKIWIFQTPSTLLLSGITKSTTKKAVDDARTKEVKEDGSKIQNR